MNCSELYRKAAAQGLVEAQNQLAAMYCKGEGVQADKRKAIELYARAAEQGARTARHSPGRPGRLRPLSRRQGSLAGPRTAMVTDQGGPA